MDNRKIEEIRENETKLIDEIKQLEKENQELKKMQCTYLGTGCQSKMKEYKSQQKEFIEYLENEIKRLENTEFYIEGMQKAAIATHKHNLSKYKEIIGGKEYCVEKDENANQINVSHNCKYTILLNEYQNWLAKEKEVVYRDCGHTQNAITKCYDKLVYLRKIYEDNYDIG